LQCCATRCAEKHTAWSVALFDHSLLRASRNSAPTYKRPIRTYLHMTSQRTESKSNESCKSPISNLRNAPVIREKTIAKASERHLHLSRTVGIVIVGGLTIGLFNL
jgi:hypothetical protein